MNGKENKILVQVATDIKWMKGKQKDHDDTLKSIFNKLDKGSGKIEENRTNISFVKKLVFYLILPALGGLLTILLAIK